MALDPSSNWVSTSIGVDRRALLTDLAATFPPSQRNLLWRGERQLGSLWRHRHLVDRFQRVSGRAAVDPLALWTSLTA